MTDDNRVAAFAAAVGADVSNSGFQYARVYENQRHYPIAGWTDRVLPTDRDSWSDESGSIKLQRDALHPPPKCKWCGSWEAVVEAGKTDNEGWMYATGNFLGPYGPKNYALALCRRRQWRRPFRLVSTAERDQILSTGVADDAREVVAGAAAVIASSVANGMIKREWDVVSQDGSNASPASAASPATANSNQHRQQQRQPEQKGVVKTGDVDLESSGNSTFNNIASIFGFGAGGKQIPTEDPQQQKKRGEGAPAAAAAASSASNRNTGDGLAAAPPRPGQEQQQQQPQKAQTFDTLFGNPNKEIEATKTHTRSSGAASDPFANAFGSSTTDDNKSDFMSAKERAAAAVASGSAQEQQQQQQQQHKQGQNNGTGMVKEDSIFGNPNKPLFGNSGGGGSGNGVYSSSGPTLGSAHAENQQRAHQQQHQQQSAGLGNARSSGAAGAGDSLFGTVDNSAMHGASYHGGASGGNSTTSSPATGNGGGDSLFGPSSNAPARSPTAATGNNNNDSSSSSTGGRGGDSLFGPSGGNAANYEQKREHAAHDNVDDLLSKFM